MTIPTARRLRNQARRVDRRNADALVVSYFEMTPDDEIERLRREEAIIDEENKNYDEAKAVRAEKYQLLRLMYGGC